ncbi:alpha/beta hydrolase [Paenibacillus albus]|uniref:Alpha/beta hydrolase n=2 Tax=Paenibacillus albus TaxID=2495582 RepID=A0A3S9ADH2_9BACL|nr:alpha/beta hydrolase [Paenibacillus albus]
MPPFVFPVEEVTYKVIGERKLKFYIFEPKVRKKDRAAILFFIGGSFGKGPRTPADFQHHAEYISSKGAVAICVDYRNGHDEGFTPIQAICDVKSAVRWLREHAADWYVDQEKIVVCGSSAGGYIAVSAIMFNHMNNDGDNQSINHIPNALIIFGAGMDAVDIMARRYPELLDQAQDMSPIHNVKKCLPPTLWIIGSEDNLLGQNKDFVESMVMIGNDISWVTYAGMEHGFFLYGRHGNIPLNETNVKIEEFLQSKFFIYSQ